MRNRLIILSAFLFFISCTTQQNEINKMADNNKKGRVNLSMSDQLINRAIAAHGGHLYKTAAYSFVFRGKNYQFINNNDYFKYSIESVDDNGQKIVEVLTNNSFIRTINGKEVLLTKEEESTFSNALNSVVYFALLPYKLNDASVHTKYVEETIIKGAIYDVVAVIFDKEGGGEDHDDEYQYWINKKDNKIDYFAYNYRVNGGGARFRSAFNKRVIDGITFQDYTNWEVAFKTPLKDIPALYEKGELKEVSKIVLEEVRSLKSKK
jgi:hypothetical protein